MLVMIGRRGWGCLVLTLLTASCQPRSERPHLCAPPFVEPDFVRIVRTAEFRHLQQLTGEAASLGLRSPLAAVYELSPFPYKPLFYFVTGEGEVARERLLEVALETFQGARRARSSDEVFVQGEVRFLCTNFDRGRGMVAMSVACAWSQAGSAGYAVRLAGASLPMDFKPIAALRAAVARGWQARSGDCPDMRWVAEMLARPADRDQMVRDAVAAIGGFEVQRLAGFFPEGARELFRARLEPAMLRGGSGDALERVTHVLGTLEYPRSETLEIETVTETADRVVLRLASPRPRAYRLPALFWLTNVLRQFEDAFAEAARREAEMVLVRAGDGWRIDARWALAQVQDWYLKTYVLWPSLPPAWEAPVPFGDPAAVRERMQAHLARQQLHDKTFAFAAGVSPADAPPHTVYADVAEDGRAVCLSARSASGERFMKRVDSQSQTTLARGNDVPDHCPARPLSDRW